jgi:biopolymer transport protein ExbD
MLMAMWSNDSADDAQPLARIDMTPMIGVLAALLALFVLCTPILSEAPVRATPNIGDWFAPMPHEYEVRLAAGGSLLVDGMRTSAGEFENLVSASEHASRKSYFHLHIAAQTRYEDLAALLETLSRHHVQGYDFEK